MTHKERLLAAVRYATVADFTIDVILSFRRRIRHLGETADSSLVQNDNGYRAEGCWGKSSQVGASMSSDHRW